MLNTKSKVLSAFDWGQGWGGLIDRKSIGENVITEK
jgi:hypothetical protein